jgi:hypothetical protein
MITVVSPVTRLGPRKSMAGPCEIGSVDLVVCCYGAVLGACHALTGTAWFTYKHIALLLTGRDSICWPLWPGCDDARQHLSRALVTGLTAGYIAMALAASSLFAARRARAGRASLLAPAILGTFLYALDYRMRMNQTYMLSWVAIAFLVAPRRVEVVQVLVALFYFWAGTLKCDREWLSGAALYEQPLLIPRSLTTTA